METVPVICSGNTMIRTIVDNSEFDITVKDVLCVPNLSANLLSVSQLIQNGNKVSFEEEVCYIRNRQNILIGKANLVNGVYKLNVKLESLVACSATTITSEIWHRRLGHINSRDLNAMRNGAVDGISYIGKAEIDRSNCITCCEGQAKDAHDFLSFTRYIVQTYLILGKSSTSIPKRIGGKTPATTKSKLPDSVRLDGKDHYIIRNETQIRCRECHKNTKFKCKQPIRPLLARDGTPRYRAADRAEIFAEHLETQFQPNPSRKTQHAEKVQNTIRRRKLQKAPGPDGITNETLRHLPSRGIAAVTRLYNGVLRTGYLTTQWKLGRVIMLPKPGKNILLPGSCRPIHAPVNRLEGFRETATAAPDTTHPTTRRTVWLQSGALNHASAREGPARPLGSSQQERVSRRLDMEKAFDRVWHPGLLYKLATSTTPRRIVRIMATLLQDRRFQVSVEGTLSTQRPIRAGVPQRSCLSPICYSKYTDDIPVAEGETLAPTPTMLPTLQHL
ncbi:reverse transcriptase [Danaus plexippus plexippus]|uniref:Reverse transcriptase n=1 Tax=Danaus plexippus plexippus TaxID=278856 RepID=A0A212FPG2_DANPL|nr:reverse transcriptase [Danaus plexippus plexippus]